MNDELGLEDEFDRMIEANRVKSEDELTVERIFPNLPSHVLKDRTATEFLWLSSQEQYNLINFGNERWGSITDPWTEIGG